jgi:hypothetical protein
MKKNVLLLGAAVLFWATGCASSQLTQEDLCRSVLPEFDRDFAQARNDLGPDLQRLPATQGSHPAQANWDGEKKDYWKEWSVSHLRKAQKIHELVSRLPASDAGMKTAATEAADEWVLVYSYAENAEIGPMTESLQKIERHHQKVRESACR